MSPWNQRRACVLRCLFAQLVFVGVVVGALWWEVRTFFDHSLIVPARVGEVAGEGTTVRGWPVVWAEWRQTGTYAPPPPPKVVTLGKMQVVVNQKPRAVYDTPQLLGWNPAFPVAVLLIAVCLPTVVCDRGMRRTREDGPSQIGWLGRLFRAGTFAGVVGVTVTLVEMESDSQQSDRYIGCNGPWLGATPVPPTDYIDTLVVDLRRGVVRTVRHTPRAVQAGPHHSREPGLPKDAPVVF